GVFDARGLRVRPFLGHRLGARLRAGRDVGALRQVAHGGADRGSGRHGRSGVRHGNVGAGAAPRGQADSLGPMRVDKWLWAARFFKTRSLAAEAIAAGHVSVNGERAKPAKALRAGDAVEIRK